MDRAVARRGRAPGGMTLIELMVGIAVLALLLAIGMPSFSEWMINTRVRTTAETLQSGLQMARAEAVRRNMPVRFQLTTTVDNSCILSPSGVYWVVNLGSSTSPSGGCGKSVSDTVSPYILQISPNGVTVKDVAVRGSASVIGFNGLGRQIAINGVDPAVLTIDISSGKGSCVLDGGTVRCLRLVAGVNGESRLCDRARTATNDPMKC